MASEVHPEITRALAETPMVRLYALSCAASMVFGDDPKTDPIFAKLSGPERAAMSMAIQRAAFAVLSAKGPDHGE